MPRTSWAFAVVAFGLLGAAIGMLVGAGVLPTPWSFAAVTVIPLLVLGAAFVGVMSTGAYIVGSLVGIVAIVAPIIDTTSASLAAGNFDDATGYGVATGLAIALSGAVAFVFALRRRAEPARMARPSASTPAGIATPTGAYET